MKMTETKWRETIRKSCKQKMESRDSSAYCVYCRRRDAEGNVCNFQNCPDTVEVPSNKNEKYNLPCPYNPNMLCVQMPSAPEDDNYCDDRCPTRER